MLNEAQEFETRARQVFDGSPYTVTTTDDGFRVEIDVADARWYGLYSQSGLKFAWRHDVKVVSGRYSITDRSTEMRWRAGVPTVSWSKTGTTGTQVTFRSERTWAFDEQGNFRRVVDYQFNSHESKQALKDIGESLGLKPMMNAQAKIGLIVGLAGAGLALIVGLVLVILALTGNLG